jgi:hypothetical protein
VSVPDELRPALAAGKKLRRLVIVCPRDHTLAEVYPGTDGLLWLVATQSALIVTQSDDPMRPHESLQVAF